jgi:hypothetical protein
MFAGSKLKRYNPAIARVPPSPGRRVTPPIIPNEISILRPAHPAQRGWWTCEAFRRIVSKP